jgi:hypothetical protein
MLGSTNMISKTQKAHYTETEAAEELGISVEQLRTLIRHHVVDREEDLQNVPVATFQPSDLLLLKFLAASQAVATPTTAG